MHYLGSPKEAEKFKFTLQLHREGFKSVIQVTRPVVSAEMNYHLAGKSTFAFAISFDEIRQKWHNEEQTLSLCWKVSVYREESDEVLA